MNRTPFCNPGILGMVALVAFIACCVPTRADDYALIVGVNECPQFQLPNGSHPKPLRGAETDADTIARTLVDQYRWPSAHVRVLKGVKATRSAIETAFIELATTLHPEDAFVFHFSGHGTRVADRKPFDEPDYVDEAVCPSDATASGENLIIDDDLGKWLESLPCRKITVILDCCHSGTGIKDLDDDVAPRFLLIPQTPQNLASTAQTTEKPWGDIQRNTKSFDRQITALYACKAEQQAYERRLPELQAPARVGQFSHFLVEGLRDKWADTDGDGMVSHREAIEYVRQRIDDTFNRVRDGGTDRQEPVMECDAANAPLFGKN
ncbi:MAG: caspase family protein [Planctomycetes bacterium]|nr:caspase family protein [Planctomycetota bacterium]